jgi:RNA-splicing ligase RtcB
VPLDECAHVYKDLDEVLAVLEAGGVARVAHRLYPLANIKGVPSRVVHGDLSRIGMCG